MHYFICPFKRSPVKSYIAKRMKSSKIILDLLRLPLLPHPLHHLAQALHRLE